MRGGISNNDSLSWDNDDSFDSAESNVATHSSPIASPESSNFSMSEPTTTTPMALRPRRNINYKESSLDETDG